MRLPILPVTMLLSAAACADTPPRLHVDPDLITVSGLSAGGAMAQQLHVAYADVFSGAGVIAGVPFGCANGSLATAMARCMGNVDAPLPVNELVDAIRGASADGRLADVTLLKNDPVWLFHGALDTVVAAPVSDAVAALYGQFIPAGQIVYVSDIPAAHTFPTLAQGTACAAPQSPFVGNCEYDAAGELLKHLYPGLGNPASDKPTGLSAVELPGASAAGLSETAYLFIPPACSSGERRCALHLVLHGCAQSAVQVGTAFMEQTGYLSWAAANDLVVAFPQVVPGPANPFACWDWWGYTGENYRWRDGAQMTALAAWVESLVVQGD